MVPIIMQTYNRLEYTMQVISAFKNHLLYPHKVIIIDNGSYDGTNRFLGMLNEWKDDEENPQTQMVDKIKWNGKNLGIATPKNQGVEIVHKLAETEDIRYVVITDNDIVPPFIRDNGCVLTKLVELMDKHNHIGMCGVDLDPSNAPSNQEWWWRLRQHPSNIPTFAEISIGFWFAITRYEYLKEYNFTCPSLYGQVDEEYRNWLTRKGKKIGVLKGVSKKDKNGLHIETVPKFGIHLGWTEDVVKYPDYVNMKKSERFKVEQHKRKNQ